MDEQSSHRLKVYFACADRSIDADAIGDAIQLTVERRPPREPLKIPVTLVAPGCVEEDELPPTLRASIGTVPVPNVVSIAAKTEP